VCNVLCQIDQNRMCHLSFAMANFWWEAEEHKRKIHWISWNKLCLSKTKGGMGFKDLQCFNQALLAKQAWRLIQFPHCLFSRVIKSMYYDNDQFLNAPLGSRPSYGWRSILHGRNLLRQG